MRDVTTGEYIPTELDADFMVSVGAPGDLVSDGTPIGVHEVEYEGDVYEVRCTIRWLRDAREEDA